MKLFNYKTAIFCVGLLVFAGLSTMAQTRAELEKQRKEIQQQIKQISGDLNKSQAEEKSVLAQVEELNQRIKATENLIRVSNQEANLLTKEIDNNTRQIESLQEELKTLKKAYAKMIRQSYRSKSQQNRIMFLFSSESFFQAYKRIQYMKQHSNHRKKQGEEIELKKTELEELNQQLVQQKKEKEVVLAQNRKAKKELEADKKSQEKLVQEIREKEKEYEAELAEKQKEIDRIDDEIDRLIKAAIAAENKKAGSSSEMRYKMTPEAKLVAEDFEKNKGKLPWPVKSGLVSMQFGEHAHPIVKSAKVSSNGVKIETEENGVARVVFDGEVSQVNAIRGGNKAVLVRHGNYITVYYNLTDVFVKRGDQLSTNDEIGVIGKSNSTGKTTLTFQLYYNTTKKNPKNWIYKM
ncbi:MAG: murein hydrolase activator EnvC family protein [Bacteroidota bacterium]